VNPQFNLAGSSLFFQGANGNWTATESIDSLTFSADATLNHPTNNYKYDQGVGSAEVILSARKISNNAVVITTN
jgi:hypothetical protein